MGRETGRPGGVHRGGDGVDSPTSAGRVHGPGVSSTAAACVRPPAVSPTPAGPVHSRDVPPTTAISARSPAISPTPTGPVHSRDVPPTTAISARSPAVSSPPGALVAGSLPEGGRTASSSGPCGASPGAVLTAPRRFVLGTHPVRVEIRTPTVRVEARTPPVRVGIRVLAGLPDRLGAAERVLDRAGGPRAGAVIARPRTGLPAPARLCVRALHERVRGCTPARPEGRRGGPGPAGLPVYTTAGPRPAGSAPCAFGVPPQSAHA